MAFIGGTRNFPTEAVHQLAIDCYRHQTSRHPRWFSVVPGDLECSIR